MVCDGLGVELDEIVCVAEVAQTTEDLDLGSHDEPDRRRGEVGQVDMRAQRDLVGLEGRCDALHRRLLDQLQEDRRREHGDPLVAGLVSRHPLLHPRLALIGHPDLDLAAHPGVTLRAATGRIIFTFHAVVRPDDGV